MRTKNEKPPAAGIAGGFQNQTKIYEPQNTTKACLCGEDFQPGSAFVVTETPLVTITRVCATCSDTLASGSFAERAKLARLLLAKAKGGRSE